MIGSGGVYFKDPTFDCGGLLWATWSSGALHENPTITLTSTTAYIRVESGAIVGGSISGTLSASSTIIRTGSKALTNLTGVDMSGVTGISTGAVCSSLLTDPGRVNFINCKVPSGISLSSGPTGFEQYHRFVSTDSAGNLERLELWQYHGNTVSSTGVYRDNSLTDTDASSKMSYLMTPDSTTTEYSPLYGAPIVAHISSTGSKTFTLELAHNFTASLDNNTFWLEMFSLDTSGSILSTFHDARVNSPIDTPTTLTTSSETWTGVSGYTMQKVTVTTTINKTGVYYIRPVLGKYEASKLCYHDSEVTVA